MNKYAKEYAKAINSYVERQTTSHFEDSVSEHAAQIQDAYSNSVLGIGQSDHIAQFNEYGFDNNTLNWALWMSLYNESWVFKRVIDATSQDMITPGISIQGTNDYTDVYQALSSLQPDLIDSLRWSKLFGGSVMVMLFKGVSLEEMKSPMREKWKKIEGNHVIKAYVTDRWFGCSPSYDDIVSNLANDDFGKPKYYDITFSDGSTHTIHHSWVLRFENRTAPNLIKTGQLQGWGYAEGAHILNVIMQNEKLKASMQSLLDKSLIEIIKMPGMMGLFLGADKNNEEQLKQRLEFVNWARNFNSLTFLDKDDEYDQRQFSGLSGIADILDLNEREIAAAVEMPNILFGDLSNGFTSDDDAMKRYDKKIQNDCNAFLRKPMKKLVKVLYHMYGIKDSTGKYESPSFTFNSIMPEQKNEKLVADVQSLFSLCNSFVEKKLMTPEQEVQTLNEYLKTGSMNIQLVQPVQKAAAHAEKAAQESADDDDLGDVSFGSSILRQKEPSEAQISQPNINNQPDEESASNELEMTQNEPQNI